MKAEADRDAVAAGRSPDVAGNKLKFQRGAAANAEFKDRNKGAEKIILAVTVAGPRKSSFSSPCGDLSKDNGICRCGNVPFGTPY